MTDDSLRILEPPKRVLCMDRLEAWADGYGRGYQDAFDDARELLVRDAPLHRLVFRDE